MANQIRAMTERDSTDVVRIIREHDGFDGACCEDFFRRYFADPDRVRSRSEGSFVVLGGSDGRVAGTCGFIKDKYETPGIYWLTWLYVDRAWRGHGLGSQLLGFTIDLVKTRDAKKLYLDTSSDPKYKEAISLYAKFDFEVEGRLKDYYGPGEDYLILGKVL